MTRENQRTLIKSQRESLKKELENIYLNAFEKITVLNLNDADIAKLSQLFLQSQEGAIKPLNKEIEKPLITKAPKENK